MSEKLPSLPRLYLMRHGETAWSLTGQHTSRTDIALTESGEKAVCELGQRLLGITFGHVFTSPLLRSQHTCELAGLGATAVITGELSEWDYGVYEGQTSDLIHQDRPAWNLFRDGCPGGETPQQVSDRADRFIVRLRERQGNVAVFTHGHFGRVLASRWLGLSVLGGQYFLLSPGSLCILGYEHNRSDQPAIILWNSLSQEPLPSDSPSSADKETRPMVKRAIETWEDEGGEIPHKQQHFVRFLSENADMNI